jgi:TolB-like protein
MLSARLIVFLSVLTLGLPLAGCMAVMAGSAGVFAYDRLNEDGKLSLTSTTYSATDMLTSQARHNLNKATPLIVLPLEDLKAMERIAETPEQQAVGNTRLLGQVMSGQVSSRLTQLGYNVVQGHSAAQGTPATVSGSTLLNGSDVIVNLRIVDSKGRVLGSYDYVMPVTSEIRSLTNSTPSLTDFIPSFKD